MIIYRFRPKQFSWLARHLDWVIRKTKAIKKWLHRVTLKFSAVEKQIFPKGNFLSQKYFLLLDNLFTPSFIFGLHLNYLIHYWKNMLNITPVEQLVVTSIIFERNIGGEISKSKWLFKTDLSYLAILSSTASSRVLAPFQPYGYLKKAPKKILPTFFPCIFYGKTKWNCL